MAGPIARLPAGLLDLLLTQQQGKNPQALGEMLIPTMDLGPFYNQNRLVTSAVTVTATAVGSLNSITVPAGETWRLMYAGCRGTFATVNQTIRLGFRISGVPGNAFIDVSANSFAASGATDTFGTGFDIPEGIIFPSGVSFSCIVQEINLDAQPNIAVNFGVARVRMNK